MRAPAYNTCLLQPPHGVVAARYQALLLTLDLEQLSARLPSGPALPLVSALYRRHGGESCLCLPSIDEELGISGEQFREGAFSSYVLMGRLGGVECRRGLSVHVSKI